MQALTILITGATAGIGRHAALALARAGHHVFATGRREAALETLRTEARGTLLETLTLDVTSASSIADAKREIDLRTKGYGIDVLVNNAGYGLVGPLEMIDDADLRSQFDTNVFGLMSVTRAFLPAMHERGAGRIINVSSIGGRMTFPLMGAYHASKYALEALSDALRLELEPQGIHVSIIEPGPIRTEFNDRALEWAEKYQASDSPYASVLAKAEAMSAMLEKTSVGPESVVRAIVKAIESSRPRARYLAPFSMHFAVLLMALLPTGWSDALFRAVYGLNRGAMLMPAKPAKSAAAELAA
jgi:short-subunit dehydrogenase